MPFLRPAVIATLLSVVAVPALAQNSGDLAVIRRQIEELQSRKAEDEKRIADLEARLARAEAAARAAPAAAPQA